MSTSKTQHYQLHAWALGDEVPMSEFNENFTKLDAALKAEQTARSTGLAGKVGVMTGTYTGDGNENREIIVGMRPKAVHVEGPSGCRDSSVSTFYGGLIPEASFSNRGFTVPKTANRSGLLHTYAVYF